jgi:hypothetical protein
VDEVAAALVDHRALIIRPYVIMIHHNTSIYIVITQVERRVSCVGGQHAIALVFFNSESVSLPPGDRVFAGARKTTAVSKFFTVQQVADLLQVYQDLSSAVQRGHRKELKL